MQILRLLGFIPQSDVTPLCVNYMYLIGIMRENVIKETDGSRYNFRIIFDRRSLSKVVAAVGSVSDSRKVVTATNPVSDVCYLNHELPV